MDDRRQEAVRIIARAQELAYKAGQHGSKHAEPEYYYDRIAPLIRGEFPEIQEFCKLFLKTCNRGFYPNEKMDKAIAEANKKVCPTCGGSKKVPIDNCCSVDCEIPSHREDCPDCGGTGECQHKNVVEVKDDLPARIYCDDCQQYLDDRRSRKERREGHGRRIDGSRRSRTGRRAVSDEAQTSHSE